MRPADISTHSGCEGMPCACHTCKKLCHSIYIYEQEERSFVVQAIIININGSLTNNLTKFALLENYCLALKRISVNYFFLFFICLVFFRATVDMCSY